MRYLIFAVERRLFLVPLILTAIISILIFVTCSDDSVVTSHQTKPNAKLISQSECKGNDARYLAPSAASCTPDCLEYWLDSAGDLHIKHINAGFNCCIDSVAISVEVVNSVALITENEDLTNSGCHCLCLYDIEYVVSNLPSKVTKVEIMEPYAYENDLPLCCSLPTQEYDTLFSCVERCHYPWMGEPTPEIHVTNDPKCKSEIPIDPYFECAEWELSENALILKHKNTYYNCCADSITASMEIHADTIFINEWEHGEEPCDCVCLYDIDMVLTGITPGAYHFIIRNGNYPNGFPKLKWTVDLLQNPTGNYCDEPGGGGE